MVSLDFNPRLPSSLSPGSSPGDAWRDTSDHPGLPPASDEEGRPQQGQGEEGGPQQGLDTKEIAENIFLRYCDFITYHAHVFYLIFSGPVEKKPFEIEWHFVLPQKKPLLFGFDEWQAE